MNHQNAAESTVQAFFRSWFEQCDAEGTLSFLQVLINILSNAIKFTGEGGKVTFSAAQRKRTKNGGARLERGPQMLNPLAASTQMTERHRTLRPPYVP